MHEWMNYQCVRSKLNSTVDVELQYLQVVSLVLSTFPSIILHLPI